LPERTARNFVNFNCYFILYRVTAHFFCMEWLLIFAYAIELDCLYKGVNKL
jgi:hypothetical protein